VPRNILPQRRCAETFEFEHWGLRYLATVGYYADHVSIGEVFLVAGKSGEQMETLTRDSAVLLSIAIQHGTPIEAMRGAVMRDRDGSPSGPIGRLLDLIGEPPRAAAGATVSPPLLSPVVNEAGKGNGHDAVDQG
jgi:hypothetical protein